ncbi:PucR family transcriptional regulator [Streptomyces sp. NPDC090106]|uniref:PucR family transcriptional regulator n=1 Tax=Streptomyces sp. NPDC090106 TaxID=3365946 RepID=UPI0037F86606
MASRSPVTVPASLLRHLVTALTGPLVDLLVAPRGVELPLDTVVIVEPDDLVPPPPGALALVIGVRGRAALRALLTAGRAGAVAVAVKTGTDPGDTDALREAATECGTALLAVRDDARWEQVAAVARTLVDVVHPAAGFTDQQTHGDLPSLAQTLATLTGGIVSIEDSANRVLAYSRSDDHVDAVRRLSILGQSCPEPYLAFLRETGVSARLRAGEEVVEVTERADLGARRRLAAGILVGGRPLGTIWVQEGAGPLAERAPEVLRGAARLAAVQLVRRPRDAARDTALREEFAAGLLAGQVPPGSLAASLGLDPERGATVVAVDLRDPAGETVTATLRRSRTAEIASVHAAAFRRTAVATQLDGRIYVLLPESEPEAAGPDENRPGRTARGGAARPAGRTGADAALRTWTTELVTTLRTHLGTPVQAAVTAPFPRLAQAPLARRTVDRMLTVLARTPELPAAAYPDVRAAVVLDEILDLLTEHGHPGTHDPALDVLTAYDRRHGTDLAPSLLLYLDAFGDVAKVAERLHIHPNTLRHRVRRAAELTGIDLDDPEQRLVALLQLRRPGGP